MPSGGPEAIAAGHAPFRIRCASCHGADTTASAPELRDFTIDATVLLFTLSVSTFTAIAIDMCPALVARQAVTRRGAHTAGGFVAHSLLRRPPSPLRCLWGQACWCGA
jgi:hypothetical protein